MSTMIQLGIEIFRFWFWEGPIGLIAYFSSLNAAVSKLLSLRVLSTTFFKPWKNEYREGLVGFSIAIGIFFKSGIILIDLIFLGILFVCEIAFVLLFLLLPFVTIYILIK